MTTRHRVYAVPILHPSYIIRGEWRMEPAQVAYLCKVRSILNGERPWVPDVNEPPFGSILTPTLIELDMFRRELRRATDKRLAVDIECAGPVLLGVGFCRFADEKCLYLPFRGNNGEPYWGSEHATGLAVRWLANILEDPEVELVFQNGQTFDVPYLEALGFEVAGYKHDTLVMAHMAYPEMPRDLQFLGILYGDMPAWKWLSKLKEEGEGK